MVFAKPCDLARRWLSTVWSSLLLDIEKVVHLQTNQHESDSVRGCEARTSFPNRPIGPIGSIDRLQRSQAEGWVVTHAEVAHSRAVPNCSLVNDGAFRRVSHPLSAVPGGGGESSGCREGVKPPSKTLSAIFTQAHPRQCFTKVMLSAHLAPPVPETPRESPPPLRPTPGCPLPPVGPPSDATKAVSPGMPPAASPPWYARHP